MKANLKALSTKWVWLVLLAAIVAVSLYQISTLNRNDIQLPQYITFLVEPGTHPGWFFALLASLPMLGFPISAFCLLAGIKFGVIGGTLAIGLAMVIHLMVAYWLGQSFLKEPIHGWLANRGYEIGKIPEQHQLKYAITFVAIPLIPYAVKNYLLAMSHLRLRYYLGVAWTIQMLYSIPFVAMTGAVQEKNAVVFAIAVAGLVVVYLVSRWAKKSAGRESV